MKAQELVASLYLLGSISAGAQLTSRFYLDKASFAQGEPVFLYFSLANNGLGTVMILPVDQEQPFCSGISISVSNDPISTYLCPFLTGQMCINDGPLASPQPLLAGETYIARFPLNFDHELNTPRRLLS